MARARCAYLSVLSVCSWLTSAGDTHASMSVSAVPPSESCSTRVSLELRYGTCLRLAPSVSALITLPSSSSPRLMATPSLKRAPSAPVSFCRSLPARSTRFMRDLRKCSSGGMPLAPGRARCSMVSVTMACDRDDCSFILCAPTARTAAPASSSVAMSVGLFTSTSVAPSTNTSPSAVSLISHLLLAAPDPLTSRSLMFSL
mmetsp:Transcript_36192/g.91411  ORF Transcript_36192/g.91411 Transcript_36192/m.91411 type:complete len:201 (-) Transcript_36192:112-714(-)